MKNSTTSRRIIIGEINVRPGDRMANDALRRAAELKAVPMYEYPAVYWEGTGSDKRLQQLTEWIIEIGANTVVTSAQRSSKPAHHEVGRIAMQAAIAAAHKTGQSMTVLEGHATTGRHGSWVPIADSYDSLIVQRYLDAPNMDTTYTRHLIDPAGMFAASSAELLMATGEL